MANSKRENIRYTFITIPEKLKGTIRLSIDMAAAEYRSFGDYANTTAISIFPYIDLQILRPMVFDEATGRNVRPKTGDRGDWLPMNKFNFPMFCREFGEACDSLKIREMYAYTGTRLDLNDALAETHKRSFKIGDYAVEIIPTILETEQERLEGLRITINSEPHSVSLTLNEITSLRWSLEHLDVDNLALTLYNRVVNPTKTDSSTPFSQF